jgi:hypothetical protein
MKRSLNFFELHVEKILLGLVGAFTLALVWMYLINTPNKVEYGGELVSAGELDAKILIAAERLQQRVRDAKPVDAKPVEYSKVLAQKHAAGILGQPGENEGPPVPAVLRRTAPFGTKIEVPGLSTEDESQANIAVVTPLRMDRPVAETGRSMVIRDQVVLAAAPAVKPDAEQPAAKPVETPWVTVAAYFDPKAQKAEMTAAGYPGYRSSVYVVGMDVQRQEILANGEWSEWRDVPPGKAMPKIDIPDPVIEETTGRVINKEQIDQAYALVRGSQPQLMQPRFFPIEAGDEWETPPLAGHEPEPEDDADTAKPKKPREPKETKPRPSPRGGFQQPTGGRSGLRGGGGGAIGISGGGGRTPPVAPGGDGRSDAREKAEARKRADDDLKEAEKAFKDKDYGSALMHANAVIGNENATRPTKEKAEELVKKIEEKQKEVGAAVGGEGGPIMGPGRVPPGVGLPGGARVGGGVMLPGSGGRMPGMAAAAPAALQEQPLVTHPDNNQPAVWFHDDSVESGKTYRYRSRIKLWNRYVGQLRAVKNPEDAKKTVLVGEWSLPSDPITVTPATYFFVRGQKAGQPMANVEVWKWREGKWLKETFDVGVGDTIGAIKKIKLEEAGDGKAERVDVDFTTGAVVLDLRFDEKVRQRTPAGKEGEFNLREAASLVMVYVDPADGQVKERVALFDKNDPTKKKLEKGEES